MPVIQFPGYTKDPFGGPAGGTQQMFAAMLSSYMKTQEEQKKREQEKLLAELLAGGGKSQPLPGMEDPTGPAMNTPMPEGGYPAEGPEDYQSRARAVMGNPGLDLKQKIAGLGMLNAQKELEPDPVKTKYITINWRDKNGVAQAPYVVPEDQANRVYAQLDQQGATWEKADKVGVPSDAITQIEVYQQQYGQDDPMWGKLEKRKEEIRAKEAAERKAKEREKGASEYTRAQLVDDTFKFYNSKLIGLTDELTKRPLKGMEQEHAKIMSQLQRDQALIEAGKKPTWLTEEGTIPEPEKKVLTDATRDTFIQEVIKENPKLTREEAIKAAMIKAARAGY